MAARQKISTGRKIVLVVLSIVTAISLEPIVGLVIAGVLANHFGCRVDEGSIHPCHAFGTDIGAMLYALGVMGWLMLITIPLLIFALIGWIVVFATRRRD